MNEEYFIFLWLAVFAALSKLTNLTRTQPVLGKERQVFRPLPAMLAFLPIYLLAATGQPRADTWLYLSTYDSLPSGFGSISSYLANHEKGPAFSALGIIIKTLFGPDRIYYRLILGALHSLPVIWIYRKYSDSYLSSIYLFAATGCHLAWMMNGLRQFLAVVIIFSMTPHLLRRKYIPVLLSIGLAYLVHSSAIIMLPIVFIAQGKAFNKRTLLYIFAAVAATYVFANFTGALDSLLEGTEYEGTEAAYLAAGDDGANPIRILVSMVPVVFAFWGRRALQAENDPMVNLCVNMSVITAGLNAVAAVTSGIMIGRLPIYTSLYSLMLLPHVITVVFKGRMKSLVFLAMIVLYFIYYHF